MARWVGLIECVQIRAPWYLVRCRERPAHEFGITHGISGFRIGYMVRDPCSHAEEMQQGTPEGTYRWHRTPDDYAWSKMTEHHNSGAPSATSWGVQSVNPDPTRGMDSSLNCCHRQGCKSTGDSQGSYLYSKVAAAGGNGTPARGSCENTIGTSLTDFSFASHG